MVALAMAGSPPRPVARPLFKFERYAYSGRNIN